MGSTRVSEVAGIMSIGQGGQTLTGTKAAGSIKDNSAGKTDIQSENADEKLAAFDEDVRQVLKDKLGVTDEEIADAMQKLGLTVADLIQPNQLAQCGFFRNDPGIIFYIGRSRHRRNQVADKLQT